MMTFPPSTRIFLASQPADLRRSFDGLAALAKQVIKKDPLSGHMFVFRNKLGNRVKILFWDRSGFCLWYKRLERGVFRFPRTDGSHVQVEASELTLLLEGIDLSNAKRRQRFVPRSPVASTPTESVPRGDPPEAANS
jgi:transposase